MRFMLSDHKNNEYFRISRNVTHIENEVIKPGIIVQRSFGGSHSTMSIHEFSFTDAKNTVPIISTPTMTPNIKSLCLPAAFRDLLFSALVTAGNYRAPTKQFVDRIIKRDE